MLTCEYKNSPDNFLCSDREPQNVSGTVDMHQGPLIVITTQQLTPKEAPLKRVSKHRKAEDRDYSK